MEKELYALGLFKEIKIGVGEYMRRVPGGWLYTNYHDGTSACCFIPFNNEFMKGTGE